MSITSRTCPNVEANPDPSLATLSPAFVPTSLLPFGQLSTSTPQDGPQAIILISILGIGPTLNPRLSTQQIDTLFAITHQKAKLKF